MKILIILIAMQKRFVIVRLSERDVFNIIFHMRCDCLMQINVIFLKALNSALQHKLYLCRVWTEAFSCHLFDELQKEVKKIVANQEETLVMLYFEKLDKKFQR